MYKFIETQNDQRDIIKRGVGVALENLKSHVTGLESKFDEAHSWATNLLNDQYALLSDWEGMLARLSTVPAKKDFGFLLRRPSTPKGKGAGSKESTRKPLTLQDFIDADEVRRLAPKGAALCKSFKRTVDEIGKVVQDVKADTKTLTDSAKRSGPPYPTNDEAGKVLADIEWSAKKISQDYEELLSLQSTPKNISNVSKRALSHTRDTLPTLAAQCVDLSKAQQSAVENRNATMKEAGRNMQDISSLEYILSEVNSQITNLDVGTEATDVFDALQTAFRLPVAYGQVLIESVRRREWNDKMKADSSTLAEEMASFQEEEERRRKKWVKSMGDFLSGTEDASTISIEINLQGETTEWLVVSRKDVEVYLQDLKAKPAMSYAVDELTQLVKELDAPTKYQMRRAKAFKNGSIYDLGRSSLLLRGDDGTIKNLKDEKTKLEEKLKTSESRVRRLEDLLHRQGQLSRPVSGTFGIPDVERTYSSPGAIQSPRPQDDLSRKSSSNSSRRQSSTQSPQEKEFVQRIMTLEAALQSEKDNVDRLQKEAHAERRSSTESQNKMQEAESTTKDLMQNFEAREREFDLERRSLEKEIDKLKTRLEEADDELDRVADSREHERGEIDQRMKVLEAELEKLRIESTEEAQKAAKEAESLQSDLSQQRDRANSLEKQLHRHKEEKAKIQSRNSEMESELRDIEKTRLDHMNSLEAAHIHLSPEGSAPEDFNRLVKAIEILSEGLSIHARSSDEALAIANGAKRSLEAELERAQKDIEDLKVKLDAEEGESFSLREVLAQERSKISSLRSEMEEQQNQLHVVRSKFAAGETGSEALRDRVAEEERKVATLSEKLAVAESHSKSQEQELANWQAKVQTMLDSEQQLKTRMDARGLRAKDLSQRLYSQNDRMMRVLEKLGYTITREDDTMVIQRASKASASTSLGEFAPAMNRSQSGSSPVRQFAAPEDLDLLYWMQAEDSDVENDKYMAFMNAVGKFDVDAFSDAVIKRMKDIEHMARKWQKEARAYRDKSHRAQSEAHEKIAFRSFKEGDLALFLPTRNQATRPWAAFNVGAPHYFLREQDSHKLQTRDWLLARISKIEERVVDLSKSINGFNPERRSIGEASDGASIDDENPFELSDGLRWYMLDAAEEKPGAPSTPGLAKTTVASAHVDAKGSIRLKKNSNSDGATKTLSKSLDSRRSSSNSKKGISSPSPGQPGSGDRGPGSGEAATSRGGLAPPRENNEHNPESEPVVSPDAGPGLESRAASYAAEEVRKDLLFGP
jgi:autophagy-related protein 11